MPTAGTTAPKPAPGRYRQLLVPLWIVAFVLAPLIVLVSCQLGLLSLVLIGLVTVSSAWAAASVVTGVVARVAAALAVASIVGTTGLILIVVASWAASGCHVAD